MKNFRLSLIIVLISCGFIFLTCQDKIVEGELVTFDLSISEDATPKVLARMMDVNENPISEIKFEKGTYHFYPDKGLEFFVHISNHDDVLIRTAFPMKGFKNITIDGQGSEFIFHGRMIPFLIDHSSNITIQNLTIDWAQPFHSEGLVIANDAENRTFDLQISDEYPYEIRNGELVFIKEYYEHGIEQAILYDKERNAIAYNTEFFTPLTTIQRTAIQHNVKSIAYKYKIDPRAPEQYFIGIEKKLFIEQIKPGTVRIHNHGKGLPPVGKILVCKGHQRYNRLAPAFRLTFTDGFNANNVTVHHAGGMGLIAENSSDLILDNFNVSASHGRMVSTTADATHFVGCRGKVQLINCTFNNQLDDASNIHGTYQEVFDVIDEYTIGSRIGHFQQQGFQIGKAGDVVGFVDLDKSFFPYQKNTIKSITKINGRYHIITFNEKIPKIVKPGDLLENLDAYPELLVENCTISQNRARGLLLSSPRKTVIKNNYFSTEMEALLIPVESGHWYESGSVTDLLITGNTFQDCNHSGYNRGIIRFVPDDENENIAFINIVISNNKINQFDNMILEIANTENLEFTGNTITQTSTFPKLYPENPAIVVRASKNIVFSGNTYNGSAKTILETDNSMNELTFN